MVRFFNFSTSLACLTSSFLTGKTRESEKEVLGKIAEKKKKKGKKKSVTRTLKLQE
jgi:hypothetical protein